MEIKILLLLLSILTNLSNCTKCLNNRGEEVYWWVMLLTPNTISTVQYAYYDSTFTAESFQLFTNDASSPLSALGRTLNQINTLKMEVIAWNDQKPDGTTSSSAAHSKTVIAINPSMAHGFAIVHSIPKYPGFSGNKVNITIDNSQRIYGQHAFCWSQTINVMDKLAERYRTIKANIYQSTVKVSNNYPGLSALANSIFYYPTVGFQYFEFQNVGFKVKAIFKNGNNSINCSIFQDGLNHYLKSPIVSETWGRPLDPDWCGLPNVNSIKKITLAPTVDWLYTKDHSKWAIAPGVKTSCFGDMNRQSSQWKRGGAFYCIQNHPGLYQALRKIATFQSCSKI